MNSDPTPGLSRFFLFVVFAALALVVLWPLLAR